MSPSPVSCHSPHLDTDAFYIPWTGSSRWMLKLTPKANHSALPCVLFTCDRLSRTNGKMIKRYHPYHVLPDKYLLPWIEEVHPTFLLKAVISPKNNNKIFLKPSSRQPHNTLNWLDNYRKIIFRAFFYGKVQIKRVFLLDELASIN